MYHATSTFFSSSLAGSPSALSSPSTISSPSTPSLVSSSPSSTPSSGSSLTSIASSAARADGSTSWRCSVTFNFFLATLSITSLGGFYLRSAPRLNPFFIRTSSFSFPIWNLMSAYFLSLFCLRICSISSSESGIEALSCLNLLSSST